MLQLIIFSMIAIAIFVITFAKIIKENDTNYIYELAIEFIGLAIDFIYILIGKQPDIIVLIIMCLLSIVLPIILIILEKAGINLSEIIYLIKIRLKKDEIKKILLDAIEKYPNSYILHKKLATYYEQNNENEKAENEYIKAIGIQPKDSNLYFKLATVFYKEKKIQETVEILNELLNIKPDYYEGSILLGNIYYENEQFKEAMNIYNQALKYSPSKYELYYALGMTYTRLNDFNMAKEYYKKASIINSYKDISNLNLGQINLIFRDYEEAEKYFTEASKSDDDKITATAYYYLAKIKINRGEKEQAIQYCNVAIELYPKIKKKIEKDEEFIVILGKVTLKEEKEVKSQTTEKQDEIVEYLGKTYNVVEKLTDNININEKSNNIEREK